MRKTLCQASIRSQLVVCMSLHFFVSGQEISVVKMRVNIALALSLATALVGCCLAESDNSTGAEQNKTRKVNATTNVAPLSEKELADMVLEQQMIDSARSTYSPSNFHMFITISSF